MSAKGESPLPGCPHYSQRRHRWHETRSAEGGSPLPGSGAAHLGDAQVGPYNQSFFAAAGGTKTKKVIVKLDKVDSYVAEEHT